MRYFKCVGYKTNEKYFTLGKVYMCDDDTWDMTNDRGYIYNRSIDYLKGWYDFVEVSPKITVKVEGRKTIARMWLDGKLVKTRFCVCHEDDEYDYATGVEIAVKRLFDWDYERHPKTPRFVVNDKVEIINTSCVCLTDYDWFDNNCRQYASRFAYGYRPKEKEFGEVMFVGQDDSGNYLCVVKLASTDRIERFILIDEKGLKKL